MTITVELPGLADIRARMKANIEDAKNEIYSIQLRLLRGEGDALWRLYERGRIEALRVSIECSLDVLEGTYQ